MVMYTYVQIVKLLYLVDRTKYNNLTICTYNLTLDCDNTLWV